MIDRLSLARRHLCADGAVFVACDDNEAAHLRSLLAMVFGADNFVTEIEWQKRYTRSNNTDNGGLQFQLQPLGGGFSKKTSLGVRKPRHARGRLLSSFSTRRTS
jgi:hypothetical protein